MIEGHLEIFIQHQASTIFYYNLHDPENKPKVDTQLISGFLNATSLFFENLGYPSKSNIFRILRGKTELRMYLGDQIHGTLVLQDLTHLNEKAYKQLDELLKSIIHQFEKKYMEEIQQFISNGKMEFEGIDTFITTQVQKIRAHMYSSYLMRILGLAINYNVERKSAQTHLININNIFQSELDFYSIYHELNMIREQIQEYQRGHVTFEKIIKRVNRESRQVWDLFTIPLISLLD